MTAAAALPLVPRLPRAALSPLVLPAVLNPPVLLVVPSPLALPAVLSPLTARVVPLPPLPMLA